MSKKTSKLPPKEYSFVRYLSSKKSVDKRAFHQGIWQRFIDEISGVSTERLNVAEFGAGIGNMAKRLISLLENRSISYRLIDVDAEFLEEARAQLTKFLVHDDWQREESDDKALKFRKIDREIEFLFIPVDALDWMRDSETEGEIDVVIAHAFMDLVDIDQYLQALRPLLSSDGMLYFPINFDGLTQFHPEIDVRLEERLMSLYHQSMEAGEGEAGKGGSQSGQKLLRGLEKNGFLLLESGRSDWLVTPQAGNYPEDEAYFLFHILKFFENELAKHPELDAGEFEKWLAQRQNQILDAQLIFRTKQIDILAAIAEK